MARSGPGYFFGPVHQWLPKRCCPVVDGAGQAPDTFGGVARSVLHFGFARSACRAGRGATLTRSATLAPSPLAG